MDDILVRLVTHVEHLRLPSTPLAVPGSLDRTGLEKVVNHLLGNGLWSVIDAN